LRYLGIYHNQFIDVTTIPGLRFTVAIFVSGVIAGLLLIGQVEFRNFLSREIQLLRWLSSGTNSVWLKINNARNEDWVIVYLDDKSIYTGWISNYTYDPNYQDQDFLLSKASRLREDLSLLYKVNGAGVYLNTRDIKRIELIKGTKKNNSDSESTDHSK
jgi:hypothetical protein